MLIGLATLSPAAAQVTIAVNTTAQEVSVAQPTGVANANCTLGEAILAANTRANVDACLGASTPADPITLSLAAGTYEFANVGANVAVGPVSTPMALPAVTNSIAIVGNGALLRRSPNPDTPAMGFFRFDGTGLNFSASNLTLAGGVRGLALASSPDAFFSQGTASIAQFRLTDVTLSGGLGTQFNIDASGTLRLERVVATGTGGRTARSTLSASGPGPASIQVIDSEFSDTRGALSLTVGPGANAGSVLVSGSRFLRNRANSTGMGLRISSNVGGVNLTVSGSRFEDNFGSNGAGLEFQLSGTNPVSTITMSNNTFLGNVATANGGAMRVLASSPAVYRLFIQGDRYERNLALDGAAIHLSGNLSETISVTESSFVANSATNGAGIVVGNQGTITPATAVKVTRSAFLDNLDFGGVSTLVLVQQASRSISIDNSTIAGNFAADELLGSAGLNTGYVLEALTVTNNTATSLIEIGSGVASLRNSVIFANPGALACEASNGGSIQSGGGNYVQDSSCDGFSQVLNPLLGPLALNGGTTLNRLPLPGSLLINSGVAPVLQAVFDQRGQPRVRFAVADIGSVEADSQLVFVNGFETEP